MELSTNVTDYAFEADTGEDEDEDVDTFKAIVQAAYELGLLHYVMAQPVVGQAL